MTEPDHIHTSWLHDIERAIAPNPSIWDAHKVITEFQADHPDAPADLISALRIALGYFYVEATDRTNRERPGPWGPAMEMSDGSQIPPPLAGIEPEILSIWQWVVLNATSLLLVARIGDLLWCRRVQPRPDRSARAAIRAYLDLHANLSDAEESIRRINEVTRALELSKELHDEPLGQEAEVALLDIAEHEVAIPDPGAGIVIRAIQPLASSCTQSLIGRRDALLERALTVLDRPSAFESAAQLRVKALDEGARDALNRRVIQRWLDEADGAADGLIGLAHRQHALELSKTLGLRDLEDGIRVRIQSMDPSSFAFERIPLTMQIDGLDKFIDACVRDSYMTTLMLMAGFGPPSGDPQQNRRQLEEMRKLSPIQAILPRALLGPANSTIWHGPPGTPERDRLDLASHEKMKILYCGRLFREALREATTRFGGPTEQDLTDAFTTGLIEPALARQLAHGCYLIATGRIDEGVHSVLPRIEASIRELVRRIGKPITNDPKGDTPGGVRTLGVLLKQLEGSLDEGWRRYLLNALCDPLGLNLRNRVLHGLFDNVSDDEAAILTHCTAFLATIRLAT